MIEGEALISKAIELYSNLILTFVGFVIPSVTVLISFFYDGLLELSRQYENEKKQSEDNLKTLLTEQSKPDSGIDISQIKANIRVVENTKKHASRKILLLNPQRQLIFLFSPLVLAFTLNLLTIAFYLNINLRYVFLTISVVCFLIFMRSFWNLFNIIMEVVALVGKEKKDLETKTIELLTSIASSGTLLTKVYAQVDGKVVNKDGLDISLEQNVQRNIDVAIVNMEKRMVKNVEVGIYLDPEILVEKSDEYTIYTDQAVQIVRYTTSSIQAATSVRMKPLIVTPLVKKVYKIKLFIKAENMEVKNYKLDISVN